MLTYHECYFDGELYIFNSAELTLPSLFYYQFFEMF